ncbi:hypothetical protein [uncultured Shewanella sp.]|uniref:hypothetical protein n=1 Tax=uncultured Shewanella sp. TaxID=173975 RepID=UPI0026166083|nr:hypothetical protein [uncultured Shewanella sp.]
MRIIVLLLPIIFICSCSSVDERSACAFVIGANDSNQSIKEENSRPNTRENSRAGITNVINGVLSVFSELINKPEDKKECEF